MKIKKMQKMRWISVIPSEGMNYLVHHEDWLEAELARFSKCEFHVYEGRGTDGMANWRKVKPTHWMPLPTLE